MLALTIIGLPSMDGRDAALAEVLARYGIARRLYGDGLPPEAVAYRQGYDEAMARAIAVRHGRDFRERVESEVAALVDVGDRSPGNSP